MKSASVDPNTRVSVQEVPQPTPGADQLLIKTKVFGVNPKDWKVPIWANTAHNSGDDVAGVIESVGKNVVEFKKGDRVAGYHIATTEGGAFGQYALVPSLRAFHVPSATTDEEAATVPLSSLTAALALFRELGLPTPFDSNYRNRNTPVIIYGASSSAGAFGVKLASFAQLHPIIAVGSSRSEFVQEYLDATKGDVLIDYTKHSGADALVKAIQDAAKGRAFYALDAVSEGDTFTVLSKVLAGPPEEGTGLRPKLAVLLPGADYSAVDKSIDLREIDVRRTFAGDEGDRLFGFVWSRLLGKGLHDGWLKPHPHDVIPGGLNGLEKGLNDIKEGKVRAKKLVGRIEDTPGLEA